MGMIIIVYPFFYARNELHFLIIGCFPFYFPPLIFLIFLISLGINTLSIFLIFIAFAFIDFIIKQTKIIFFHEFLLCLCFFYFFLFWIAYTATCEAWPSEDLIAFWWNYTFFSPIYFIIVRQIEIAKFEAVLYRIATRNDPKPWWETGVLIKLPWYKEPVKPKKLIVDFTSLPSIIASVRRNEREK